MRKLSQASALIVASLVACVQAQAQPAAPLPAPPMPMDEYLSMLSQIAPAARDGAEAYLKAFAQRCGRALTTAELRRDFSEGSGNPTLMGMIRASQTRDSQAVSKLAQGLYCGGAR